MNATEYMTALRHDFADLVEELDDDVWQGLLHLESGCFARYTQSAIDVGDRSRVKRCFDFAHRAWVDGNDEVQNAVAVSYLEHLNFHDGKKPRAWAWDLLPKLLQAEARTLGSAP